MHDHDDLRRTSRVSVCCRVDVRDRFGFWTAVTEDVSARGCRIVTSRLPRLDSLLEVTLSSDLFAEELDIVARAVWATSDLVGVAFVEPARRKGALSPDEWIRLVLDHGRVFQSGRPLDASQIVPVVARGRSRPAAVVLDGSGLLVAPVRVGPKRANDAFAPAADGVIRLPRRSG